MQFQNPVCSWKNPRGVKPQRCFSQNYEKQGMGFWKLGNDMLTVHVFKYSLKTLLVPILAYAHISD